MNHSLISQIEEDELSQYLRTFFENSDKVFKEYLSMEESKLEWYFKEFQNPKLDKSQNLDQLNSLKEILNNYNASLEDVDNDLINDLHKAKALSFKIIPEQLVEEQSQERFYSTRGNSSFISFRKFFKRSFYNIAVYPKRLRNSFKKWRGKEIERIPFWNHTIALQQIIEAEILPQILNSYNAILNDFYALHSSCLKALINSENKRETIKVLEEKFKGYSNANEQLIKSRNEKLKALLIDISRKCDTLEYPSNPLNKRSKRNYLAKTSHNLLKTQQSWQDTFYALLEGPRLILNFNIMRLKMQESESHFVKQMEGSHKSNIFSKLDELNAFVGNLKSKLKKEQSSKESIKSFVISGRYSVNKDFLASTQKLSDLLLNHGFPGLADKLEYEIELMIEELPDTSALIINEDFTKPILAKDIDHFSPRKLISFQALPKFTSDIQSLKSELSKDIEKAYREINGFHEGLDFCFDSALDMLQTGTDQEVKLEDVIQVLESGLSRLEEKQNQVKTNIEALVTKSEGIVKSSIESLISELSALEKNEKISSIKFKITQGIAKNKSKIIQAWIMLRLEYAKDKFLLLYKFFNHKYNGIWNWIQVQLLLKKPEQEITTEISNFLAESHLLVEKLPVVYRRLYEPKPVNEVNLFKGRKKEKYLIKEAYDDWSKGVYSATVLVGEKGSGMTSLINNFLQDLKSPYRKQFYSPDRIYHLDKDFDAILDELDLKEFKNTKDEDMEDILSDKRIIIVDGLEKLFLRKVNGFDCVNSLLKLILSTNEHIFWLCTCSKQSWKYLNQTIKISDYFDHIINLENLESQEISDLILKRNQISGYRVKYEIGKTEKNSKSFSRLSQEEQQELLQDRFFKQVNKFAKSNITLALIFWVQMTKKIEGNEILIKSFEQPRFDFLEELSPEKTFVLLIVITHGGINPIELASVLNVNENQARLILRVLREDSIVIEKDNGYFILNPILYRHVLEMLKSRNLIH